MLTKSEQKFFYDLFKNYFYLRDKAGIEQIYTNIENVDVSHIRDRLLEEAEKKAESLAKIVVNKIKNKNFTDLTSKIVQSKESNSRTKFGKTLLKEINDELNGK